MKKVEINLSSARKKILAKRCAAVVSATAVLFTSMTFSVRYSTHAKASEVYVSDGLGGQKVIELSESVLPQDTQIKETVVEFSDNVIVEDESLVSEEEFSSGSEGDKEVKTEANEKEDVAESVTEETVSETTEDSTLGQSVPVVTEKGQYTFDQLGITQISDIEVPDDILFDENGIPVNYSKKLTGIASAYHMGHTTSTGTSVHPGVVAVNPNIIPYGSKMYIVTDDGWVYGYASAEDTGGFIYWDNAPIADLYVHSLDFAYEWGRQQVSIYIF